MAMMLDPNTGEAREVVILDRSEFPDEDSYQAALAKYLPKRSKAKMPMINADDLPI